MGLSPQHFIQLRDFSCFKQVFYYLLLFTCQFSSANSFPENNHGYSDPHLAKRCRPGDNSKDVIVTNPKETYHIGENITYECNEERQPSFTSQYIVYPESNRTCEMDPNTGEAVWRGPPPICAGMDENIYSEAEAGVCENIVIGDGDTSLHHDLVDGFVPVGSAHSRSLHFFGTLASDGHGDVIQITHKTLYVFERPTFISSVITSLFYPELMKFEQFVVQVPRNARHNLSPESANFSAQHFDRFFAHQKALLNVSLDNAFVVKELNVYTDRVLVAYVAMARGKFGSGTMTISFLGIDHRAFNATACSSKKLYGEENATKKTHVNKGNEEPKDGAPADINNAAIPSFTINNGASIRAPVVHNTVATTHIIKLLIVTVFVYNLTK